MKKLSELGISPWPWKLDVGYISARDSNGEEVARCAIPNYGGMINASIIAAAPELYEALREAVIEVCSKYGCAGNMPEFKCCDKRVDCFVKKWRAALEKASEEDA